MKKKCIRTHVALLTAVLVLLSACTPPTDISVLPPDDTPEQVTPPHVDNSPLAADRHKDPNAPQKVEWQRERMLYHQGYYYFWQDETISPASIDDILIDLEQIRSTVPRTDAPTENLQTNFGFVGYTVYRNEEHPEYFYIMDNGTFHVLYSPQRANKGYTLPRHLRCADILFTITGSIYYNEASASGRGGNPIDGFTDMGVITASVGADECPVENMTTNCDYVGNRVYVHLGKNYSEAFIALEEGYLLACTRRTPIPTIFYQGKLYRRKGDQRNTIPTNYQKVGSILGIVPSDQYPNTSFYSNFGAIGCEIYAGDKGSNLIYLLIDGLYQPYTLAS